MASKTLPLARYRLARAALDLRTFTVAQLVRLTQAPEGTVYAFVRELGPDLTRAPIPSDARGRPTTRYSLTDLGVDRLISENLRIAQILSAAGLETVDGPAPLGEEPAPSIPDLDLASTTLVSASADQLHGHYLKKLEVLRGIERQEMEILPHLRQKASGHLQQALKLRMERTQQQHSRLDQISKQAHAHYGDPVDGVSLIAEPDLTLAAVAAPMVAAAAQVTEDLGPHARDADLVAVVKRVEHYRVAGYGSALAMAELLGEADAAQLIQATLDEELEAATAAPPGLSPRRAKR